MELFDDENFTNLLRAESLNSMPKYLAEQIKVKDPPAEPVALKVLPTRRGAPP